MEKIIKKFKLDGKDFIFRYPGPKDVDKILKLQNLLFLEKSMAGFDEKPSIKKVREKLSKRLKELKRNMAVDLLVESDKSIEGRASIIKTEAHFQRHVGYFTIYIKKEIRGVGISQKLFNAIIDEAKKKLKIKIVILEVMSSNKRAINFYKENGFKNYGLLKKGVYYFEKPADDLLMAKYL